MAATRRHPYRMASQFATNHLWHFPLATALHDALAAAVRYQGGPERVGVADYALDPDAAPRLWELSAQAIS